MTILRVTRREFVAAVGSAAAWPVVARAQSPMVSYLQFGQTEGDLNDNMTPPWLAGLREAGFENGRNVVIEPIGIPSMGQASAAITTQVQRKTAAIFGTLGLALIAKTITSSIPIVFGTTDDPLAAGAISSYSHPSANVTGVRLRAGDENMKAFQLLHELVPSASSIGVLGHRAGVATKSDVAALEAAAHSMGVKPVVILVSDESEFPATFASFAEAKVNAVFLIGQRYFDFRRAEIIDAGMRQRRPIVTVQPDYAAVGALATYGADYHDGLRQAGIYVGRVLKGEKPSDLPVLQPTKFKFIVNLKTAKILGLTISDAMLLRADEVIE
jgi:putative tryptophan/tyrosine transport system substrate-binding protein